MQIPERNVMLRHEGMSWKVVGSNPGAGQRLFSQKIVKVNLFNHIAVEFVHETCENV